ncbi:hypothetical protein [Moraxella lacunata]|uniref:hypothetical protein n=1 Tax=Moraxella lacunata TaxID=477 RepID=UPI003EDFBEF8
MTHGEKILKNRSVPTVVKKPCHRRLKNPAFLAVGELAFWAFGMAHRNNVNGSKMVISVSIST